MRSLGRSSSFWLALVTSHFLASPSQVASHFLASPSQVASHFFASPSQVTSHKNSDSSPTRVQVAWLESTPLATSTGLKFRSNARSPPTPTISQVAPTICGVRHFKTKQRSIMNRVKFTGLASPGLIEKLTLPITTRSRPQLNCLTYLCL